jgi:xanthine dehydrogenase accessory factor
MSNAEDILRIASEWLKQGERVCMATVVRREGSAPREVGAKMVVSSSGKLAGSIGGGAVELEIIDKAQSVIKGGKPVMMEFDLSGEAPDLDALCGGNISVFLEPFGDVKRLFVIGAGHVGVALARLARGIGFMVTLVDDREEYLARERMGDGIEPILAKPDEAEAKLKIDESSAVVICTRGHRLDKVWLSRVVRRSPRYIGMLGSKHKARKIFEELEGEGLPHESLKRVRTPVGLDIGAVTPEEIAVSISAELVREWRGYGEPEA